MGRERERPIREDREENERPKTGVETSREADKDDIIKTLFGRKRSPNNEDGEERGRNRQKEKDEIFESISGGPRKAAKRDDTEEDGETKNSASKVFDRLGDVLTKSKQKKGDDPSGGHQEGAGPGVGHAIGETVGRSLRGFLQRSKVGRGALSLAANVGITGARGAAAAAGGAGGAAAGGATGAGVAAAFAGGPLTLAIAGVVLALTGLAIGIKTVLGLYNRQGDELQEFSGAIYGARAEIESERLGSKIERAQKIGGNVAQVEGAQGQFNDAMYDLFTEIYSVLAESAPYIETGIELAISQVRMLETMVNVSQAGLAVLQLDFDGAAKESEEAKESLRKSMKALSDAFIDSRTQQDENPLLDAIFNWNPITAQQKVK